MTVLIAFLVNILIATSKTVAAVLTSSASMVAEAVHSWADAGNEVFLLIADRRGARMKDARHPLGYGRAAFVWSLVAAFGIFAAGSVVSIMHGVQQLTAAEPVEDPVVAYAVLGIAFVLEGVSFTQALVRSRAAAHERGTHTWDYILDTSDTTLRAVFFEDGAALIGLVIAAGSIALHQVTGQAVWDAVGSILVGILLGVVAVMLMRRNIVFLVGANASPEIRARAGARPARPTRDRAGHLPPFRVHRAESAVPRRGGRPRRRRHRARRRPTVARDRAGPRTEPRH